MSFVLQGTQVYIFLTKGGYTLVDGYPKRLEKEFGSPHGINLETVDAAFTCPGTSRLHIAAGEGHLGTKGWLVLLLLHGIDSHQGLRRARPGSHDVEAMFCLVPSSQDDICGGWT